MGKQDRGTVIIATVADEKKRILQKEFHDVFVCAAAQYKEISKQAEYWIHRP